MRTSFVALVSGTCWANPADEVSSPAVPAGGQLLIIVTYEMKGQQCLVFLLSSSLAG